jgi:RNA polymerase sigma-70 factor (ECF subfamily)
MLPVSRGFVVPVKQGPERVANGSTAQKARTVSRMPALVAQRSGKLSSEQSEPAMRSLPRPSHSSAAALAPRAERIEPRLTDRELIERLASGDHWAKEALYRRYVKVVWSTALRLTRNQSDAEDIVQDTFVEALRDLPQLRQLDALRPWLLRIAVHQAHRRFRRRALLRRLGLDRSVDDVPLATLAHPGASPELCSELVKIERALERASAAERFAWVLRHVEGYTLEEVAESCRCSLATVKRRIGNATLQVHAQLGGQGDG